MRGKVHSSVNDCTSKLNVICMVHVYIGIGNVIKFIRYGSQACVCCKIVFCNIEMTVSFYKKAGCVYRIFIEPIIWCSLKAKQIFVTLDLFCVVLYQLNYVTIVAVSIWPMKCFFWCQKFISISW